MLRTVQVYGGAGGSRWGALVSHRFLGKYFHSVQFSVIITARVGLPTVHGCWMLAACLVLHLDAIGRDAHMSLTY